MLLILHCAVYTCKFSNVRMLLKFYPKGGYPETTASIRHLATAHNDPIVLPNPTSGICFFFFCHFGNNFANTVFLWYAFPSCRYRRWGTRASRPGPAAWALGGPPRCPRRPRRAPRKRRRPRQRRRPRPRGRRAPRVVLRAGVPGNTCSSPTSTRPTSSPRICCTPTGNKARPRRRNNASRRVSLRMTVQYNIIIYLEGGLRPGSVPNYKNRI